MLKLIFKIINCFLFPLVGGIYIVSGGIELLFTTNKYYLAGACIFCGLMSCIALGIWTGLNLFSKFSLKHRINEIISNYNSFSFSINKNQDS